MCMCACKSACKSACVVYVSVCVSEGGGGGNCKKL